jgi:hypothetical protein
MTVPSGRMSRTPFAHYDPDSSSWRTLQQSLLPASWGEPSVTWPPSGMWDLGAAYEQPTSVPRIGVPASSSPPTLLPTPVAMDKEESGKRLRHDGRTETDHGARLTDVIPHLLKTPTSNLATNGGSQHPDKRRAGGHGPTLADQVEVELLPTPTVQPLLPTPRSQNGEARNNTIWQRPLDQPQNLENAIARLPGASTSPRSDAGNT